MKTRTSGFFPGSLWKPRLALLGCVLSLGVAPFCFWSQAAVEPQSAPATSTPVLEPAEVMNFALLDHRGDLHELRRSGGQAVVLFFTGNECPIARQNALKLRKLSETYSARGVRVFLVNSCPADDRKSITKESSELRIWHLPVLKDDTQGVARHLKVKRTGETIAISTKDWSVFYRGAVDDQMVEGAQKPEPTERYLENALDAFLAGQKVKVSKTVARGCLIHFEGEDGPDSAPVSYAKQVVPILEKRCVGCHSQGNIGSWAMSSHRKVKGMSSMMEEVILTRRMPPWDADPHVSKFVNEGGMEVKEAQTLLRWIHQGALRDGDVAGEEDPLVKVVASLKPAEEWPLGKPDVVLRLPKVEKIPATGVLDYRHIEVKAGNVAAGWVGAVWVKPGNAKVVHHVIARLKKGGQKDHLGTGEMYAGWAPGTTQGWFPEGSGKFLPADAVFDFEMHYTPNGMEQTDQTEIGLYLLKEKATARFETVPVVSANFEIKPGDPDSKTEGMYCFKKPATLYSLTPHMHLRGKWMKFEVMYPNGKREVVCSVPRYDFNWQHTYMLDKPRKLPAGTWVRLSGGFDNSDRNPANPDPKKTVHWGDQSFEEMFLGWYNVTWDPEPAQQARQ